MSLVGSMGKKKGLNQITAPVIDNNSKTEQHINESGEQEKKAEKGKRYSA